MNEFFKLSRIGRIKYLAYTNLIYGVLAYFYYMDFGLSSDFSLNEAFSKNPYILVTLVTLSFVPLKFLAQRYKDTGLSPWWALVGLIPYSYFMLYFLLGSYRGENYKNRHGDIPNKSGAIMRLLAFMPIVAAIFLFSWGYFNKT